MNLEKDITLSSRPEVFWQKGVLKNFAKFKEKHLCYSIFLRIASLFKKRLWHSCLPVNFAKFLRAPFSIENLRWLLLYHRIG